MSDFLYIYIFHMMFLFKFFLHDLLSKEELKVNQIMIYRLVGVV